MKRIFFALISLISVIAASADVVVRTAPESEGKEYIISKRLVSSDDVPNDTIVAGPDGFRFKLNADSPGFYSIFGSGIKGGVRFFAEPGDSLIVIYTNEKPIGYDIVGTPLTEGVCVLYNRLKPVEDKMRAVDEEAKNTRDVVLVLQRWKKLYTEKQDVYKDFIREYYDNPAALVTLYEMQDPESFMEAYGFLVEKIKNNDAIKSTVFYERLPERKEYMEKWFAAQKRTEELQSGTKAAPDFTLKDVDGKEIKLSDYRGKWVIVDFWATWCEKCIDMFPEFKKVYKKYSAKLEFIGINLDEKEEVWRERLPKYNLPWINVRDSADSELLAQYGVQGYPTTAVINPEGIIKYYILGESSLRPKFSDVIRKLIAGEELDEMTRKL